MKHLYLIFIVLFISACDKKNEVDPLVHTCPAYHSILLDEWFPYKLEQEHRLTDFRGVKGSITLVRDDASTETTDTIKKTCASWRLMQLILETEVAGKYRFKIRHEEEGTIESSFIIELMFETIRMNYYPDNKEGKQLSLASGLSANEYTLVYHRSLSGNGKTYNSVYELIPRVTEYKYIRNIYFSKGIGIIGLHAVDVDFWLE